MAMTDTYVAMSGGSAGAGVGRPEERDPEAVRMDVKNELVSIDEAKNIYKVICNHNTLEIDYESTKTLRADLT